MPDAIDDGIDRAGFQLTAAQRAEYRVAYAHVCEMARLIRAPLAPSLSYMAEPAHMFSFPKEAKP